MNGTGCCPCHSSLSYYFTNTYLARALGAAARYRGKSAGRALGADRTVCPYGFGADIWPAFVFAPLCLWPNRAALFRLVFSAVVDSQRDAASSAGSTCVDDGRQPRILGRSQFGTRVGWSKPQSGQVPSCAVCLTSSNAPPVAGWIRCRRRRGSS